MMTRQNGPTMLLIALFILIAPSAATRAAEDAFATQVGPFLKKHCLGCHGAQKQASQIRFDKMEAFRPAERNLWTLIHEKIASGEMPPKDRDQPTDTEKQKLLTWIERQQRAAGVDSTRRLNRREVSAALRDLTGLTVDYTQSLPGDGTVAGFDTGAEGLQDAADGVTQWLRVSRRAVDAIRFRDQPPGKPFFVNLRQAGDARKALEEWKNDGANIKAHGIARPGMGLLLEPRAVGDREALSFHLPVPADGQAVLRLRVVVSVMKPLDGLPHPRLWVEIGGKDVDYREINGSQDAPQELIYQVQLEDLALQPRGVHISLANKVEVPYAVPGFENEERGKPEEMIPGGTGLFRPLFDRRALPPERQPAPFIVLQQIEVQPDHVVAWPPAEWKVAGEIREDAESASRLLALWMERAWRRPTTEAERAPFLKLYHQLRGRQRSFDEALRAAFQSVLMSAPFRYLVTPTQTDPAIGQHAIASRLSFFLHGAPPDGELRNLAGQGRLRDPAVLSAQVDRLLAEPRSQGFFRPFVLQWLEMEQPITIASSHLQKQDFRFARHLKASMRDETVLYVSKLIRENRPARELIQSDWTLMNDILARHYGYPDLEGGTLRKVTLRPDDPRGGGILGHAGLQSMLCWMGENWVIYRGAWTLRHILDLPPPPPPLEVPELNPSEAGNRGKTFKQLLKQHQEDARCSVCHKYMDPVGFAFQNFDISGRWRTQEYESYTRQELDGKIAWFGVGKTRPVDTVGKLPRGEEFKTFTEFKDLVVRHYQKDLVRALMKNFMLYATGRLPDIADRKEIARIMSETEPRGYPLRDLIKGIVLSPAFLEPAQPQSTSEPQP